MEISHLEASKHVNSSMGISFRCVYSETEILKLHTHDYFEVFLVIEGEFTHLINEKKELLRAGSLAFVRPQDIHTYEGDRFKFLNITFTEEFANSFFTFLGDDFPVSDFLNAKMPPTVLIDKNDTSYVFNQFLQLNISNEKRELTMKLILLELFFNHFPDLSQKKDDNIPTWLRAMTRDMKKIDNFSLGIAQMESLSGKTREHISRSLKKYYGVSSTEFINDIRLTYVANLLKNSNIPILDLCFECGFENVSWFYEAFKKKYHKTPAEYRKN